MRVFFYCSGAARDLQRHGLRFGGILPLDALCRPLRAVALAGRGRKRLTPRALYWRVRSGEC